MKNKMLNGAQFEQMLCEAVRQAFDEENAGPEQAYKLSERHERRMARLFARRRPLKIFAAAVMLAVVLACSLLMLNAGVRAALRGTLIEWHDGFAAFIFGAEPPCESYDLDATWRPAYIPGGFSEYNFIGFEMLTLIEYKNAGGDRIIFQKSPAGSSTVAVNHGEHVTYSKLEHGGVIYHVFASSYADLGTNIIWEHRGFSFLISGHADPDALLAMAFSVEVTE